MLTIRLLVNDRSIDEIEVVNRGPIGGADGASYDDGDTEGAVACADTSGVSLAPPRRSTEARFCTAAATALGRWQCTSWPTLS